MKTDWAGRFMQRAVDISKWSKDPKRKVGCVIVRDHHELAGGFNGFPKGVADNDRLHDQETKRLLVVHAEANCIATAAKLGHSLHRSEAYVTRPVCTQCAGLFIQAGIRIVYYAPFPDAYDGAWRESAQLALSLLHEAGVPTIAREDFAFAALGGFIVWT